MICINSRHISLNRILLLVVGLWPYQRSKFVRFQSILFGATLMSSIVFQLTVFTTFKCTPDLLINVLSSVLFCAMFTIKYIAFSVNIESIKYLLDQMQHISNQLTDENEINIIEKYSCNAKRYTLTTITIGILLVCTSNFYAFWPDILDILFPINITRAHFSVPIIVEYFINQEKYFYLILFHMDAILIVGCTTMIATGTIMIVYQKYACSMFRIASFRIKQAMAIKILQKNSVENENLICRGLICAVDMHRKAMTFLDSMITKLNVMFFCLIIVGVINTSLNFFRILQMISREINVVEFLLHSGFIIVHIIYIILANYFGQEIIDHYNNVFATVYNVQWYVAPLRIQKMILFLLQRGTKAYNMNIAGVFVGSMEGAATLLSSVVSYFTVLYSTRN